MDDVQREGLETVSTNDVRLPPVPGRIAVAVPSGDTVQADFSLCMAGMCHSSGDLVVDLFSCKSSIVADARNIGVRRALEARAEFLLFVDSDMTFPRDTLKRLLRWNRDIVGATYVKRVPPHPPLGTPADPVATDENGSLLEMARLPTGLLLIRTAVFDRLTEPYFRFGIDEERRVIVGEDYLFCDHARKAGFRVWCDCELSREIGHIGQAVFRMED